MKRWVGLLACAIGAGCSASQHRTKQPSGVAAGAYLVRIKSAAIDERRPDGSPWDVTKPDKTMATVGALAGLVVGEPELGASIGEALSDQGGEPLPPTACVRIRALGHTLATAAVESYLPTWDETIGIDSRELSGAESALIWIIDSKSRTLIANGSIDITELLSKRQHMIELNGSAHALEVEVIADSGDGADVATLQEMSRGMSPAMNACDY